MVRLGEEDNTCSVCYETIDISAAAGVKYHRACGTMTFEPGQFMKNISIELLLQATLVPRVVFAGLGRIDCVCRGCH